jgi:hypothetical protein
VVFHGEAEPGKMLHSGGFVLLGDINYCISTRDVSSDGIENLRPPVFFPGRFSIKHIDRMSMPQYRSKV